MDLKKTKCKYHFTICLMLIVFLLCVPLFTCNVSTGLNGNTNDKISEDVESSKVVNDGVESDKNINNSNSFEMGAMLEDNENDVISESTHKIIDSSITDSSITSSSITGSSITGSSITDSSITDSSITDSSITDSSITDSSITYDSLTDVNNKSKINKFEKEAESSNTNLNEDIKHISSDDTNFNNIIGNNETKNVIPSSNTYEKKIISTDNKSNEPNNSNDEYNGLILNLHFTNNNNLYTNVKVGDQLLKLSLNSRLEGTYVFMKGSNACLRKQDDNGNSYCYNPIISKQALWCNNNNLCLPPILSKPYECYSSKNLIFENKAEYPNIYFDSLRYTESHIEGLDDVQLLDLVNTNERGTKSNNERGTESNNERGTESNNERGTESNNERGTESNNERSNERIVEGSNASVRDAFFNNADIKLVVDLTFYKNWSLFQDTDGILGLAGHELSCRNMSIWNSIIEKNNLIFGIDINLPNGTIKEYVQPVNNKNQNEKKKKKTKEIFYYNRISNSVIDKINIINNDLLKNSKKEKMKNMLLDKWKNEEDGFSVKEDDSIPNTYITKGLNVENTMSKIHIGGYKKNYEYIVWSEPRERGGIFSDSLMQFTIYNLEVCNNNIFGKYSSNWQGIIDLSSKCLVLPKMFWLSLMEYLPVNKNDKRCVQTNPKIENIEDRIPRMCSVDNANRPLPVLKFYVSDNDMVTNNNVIDDGGGGDEDNDKVYMSKKKHFINGSGSNDDLKKKLVYIPLDNLIINENGENNNYLCVIPDIHEVIKTETSGRTTKPIIKFGTYVLNNLYVISDQDNYKIGFVNKKNYYYSNKNCTKKAKCIGDQVYEPALNLCVNPDCSIWYFYTLNEETKRCEALSSQFYIFILILIILLLLDLQSYYFYRRSVRIAKVSSL
ncbi:peptidase, putative [Hepatocystis sp. ex Piliocolobus tephrosceles]|nr:peptidase, putative [Hepatocystis sp. ex Piliocolobus tephrosceles]